MEGNMIVKNGLLLLMVSSILLVLVLLVKVQITGFATLETFDSEVIATGSSPDGKLSFEILPNFIARIGQHVRFDVVANRNDVTFSDDTTMFDITQKGTVEFTPDEEDIGRHNVWIIIKDDSGSYYYQNMVIVIEE
ncbi:MAG: hypothetical protein V1729_05055 [Candidatus Woesearchaeota archaeon]